MLARLLAIANDHDVLSERFDHFEMKLVRELTLEKVRALTDVLAGAISELPERDRFAWTVEISGDALTIGELAHRTQIDDHITSYHEDGESIEFRIEIWKDVVQQCLSVYSPEALGVYLESTPLSEVLIALSKRFQDRLIFECYSGMPGAGSATLCFVQAGGSYSDIAAPLAWRDRSLSLLQDNAYRTDNTGTLVPQDFMITEAIGIPRLDDFMARAGAVLAAMFLSNTSHLRDNQLDYRITGYKLLAGTISDLENLVDGSATFQRIADWAYGSEGSSDKVGLARNVISLCVNRLEDVPAHSEIWDAIQSNYQIYLKENVATYLEVRNKLAELLVESTHKANALVDGLLDSVRKAVLIVLTFLLTVVVINGLKDTDPRVIFSSEYLAIVWILLGLSSLAVWASCRDARSRFDQGAAATGQLLRGMYSHVMLEEEIEKHLAPTLDGSRNHLDQQARKYLIFWLLLAVLVALSFSGGHWLFARPIDPLIQTSSQITRGEGASVRPSFLQQNVPHDGPQSALSPQNVKVPQPSVVPPRMGSPAPIASAKPESEVSAPSGPGAPAELDDQKSATRHQ